MSLEYQCPACHQAISETRYGHCIRGHVDKAGATCPASHTTFDTAIVVTNQTKATA